MFNLDTSNVVDAARKSCKMRFANHDRKNPNAEARIVFSNGAHCIGIYALRDIAAGEEILFDYGEFSYYSRHHTQTHLPPQCRPSIQEVVSQGKGMRCVVFNQLS